MSDGLAVWCRFFVAERKRTMKNIITVSRETGSGGHSIAKTLSDELGFDFYDAEIVMQVAREMKLDYKTISESGEFMTDETYMDMTAGIIPYNPFSRKKPIPYDKIQQLQTKLIKEIADKGNCVIVGRGADAILKDYPNAMHVFIHADMKHRLERVKNRENIVGNADDERIQNELDQKDHARAAFYRYYSGREWGRVSNYGIVLDTGIIGERKCCDIIKNILEGENNA